MEETEDPYLKAVLDGNLIVLYCLSLKAYRLNFISIKNPKKIKKKKKNQKKKFNQSDVKKKMIDFF